jgi:hypothetical protein
MSKIRRGLGIGGVTIIAALVPAGIAGAIQSPTTGQPGTTQGFNCTFAGATTEPGNAGNAPGSAFNESTTNPGTAGGVYAGNGPGSAHAQSTAAVSQYDTACRRLTSH